jgi:predicted  nucleic acid-binding Zn-ribbon protein
MRQERRVLGDQITEGQEELVRMREDFVRARNECEEEFRRIHEYYEQERRQIDAHYRDEQQGMLEALKNQVDTLTETFRDNLGIMDHYHQAISNMRAVLGEDPGPRGSEGGGKLKKSKPTSKSRTRKKSKPKSKSRPRKKSKKRSKRKTK